MNYPLEQIFIYPTDTVWGIGCNINSEVGFKKIALIKKTNSDKPLSILFTNKEMLADYIDTSSLGNTITDKMDSIFKLEATMLLPVRCCKKKFPSYLIKLSPFISVRLIEEEILDHLLLKIGSPIFSTSLNITGENPIVDEEEALSFKNNFCSDSIFINDKLKSPMSGFSSTIIKYDENFSIIREGKNLAEIKKVLF